MGWGSRKGGGKGKKSEGGQPSKKRTEEVEYLKAVDARWHLNKASLRAYASATGSPFYAGAGQTDSDYLSLSRIFERQDAHHRAHEPPRHRLERSQRHRGHGG